MTGQSELNGDLGGTTVLIVKDEFYLATELQEQVERAGGTVLGPCPDAPAALTQLEANPSCAVVDINLGQGPSFEIAGALQERGVPFFFLTGYDAPTVPPELAHIERIEKPAEPSRVIDVLARLTARRNAT